MNIPALIGAYVDESNRSPGPELYNAPEVITDTSFALRHPASGLYLSAHPVTLQLQLSATAHVWRSWPFGAVQSVGTGAWLDGRSDVLGLDRPAETGWHLRMQGGALQAAFGESLRADGISATLERVVNVVSGSWVQAVHPPECYRCVTLFQLLAQWAAADIYFTVEFTEVSAEWARLAMDGPGAAEKQACCAGDYSVFGAASSSAVARACNQLAELTPSSSLCRQVTQAMCPDGPDGPGGSPQCQCMQAFYSKVGDPLLPTDKWACTCPTNYGSEWYRDNCLDVQECMDGDGGTGVVRTVDAPTCSHVGLRQPCSVSADCTDGGSCESGSCVCSATWACPGPERVCQAGFCQGGSIRRGGGGDDGVDPITIMAGAGVLLLLLAGGGGLFWWQSQTQKKP